MKLELYKKDSCPFCQRVMHGLKAAGRTDVELKDIKTDPAAHRDLIERGGIDQVPCLFIDGKPLYESLDIIRWLEEHPQEVSSSLGGVLASGKRKDKDLKGSW